MKRIAITVIAALMFIAGPAASEPVVGFTVDNGPACAVNDLSTESMALITRWFNLNRKMQEPGPQGSLTDEEFAEGQELVLSGTCGLLKGGIPVHIVLSDGTLNLGKFPNGELMGFPAESFQRIPVGGGI